MSWPIDELTARLQAEGDAYATIVQVVESNSEIYIYLNRPPQTPADCPELLPIIESTLKLEFPDIQTVNIFSRELGQENPDWHTVLHLCGETAANQLSAEPEMDVNIDFGIEEAELSAESAVANQENGQQMVAVSDAIRLSSFCFSRNRQLVEGEIDRPSKEVSEIIINFHGWDQEQQIRLLQFLKEWFSDKSGSPSVPNKLSPAAREIVERMQADKELQRSLKIWFSRYCYDPQKTINEISGDSFQEKLSHSQAVSVGVAESDNTTASKTYSSYSRTIQNAQTAKSYSRASVSKSAETSTKVTTAEIIQIVITALIASGLAFVVSDVTLNIGVAGFFLFAVSVISGFVAVFKNFVIASTCTVIQILCVLTIGFTSIFIAIIGELVGVAVGISVFLITYDAKRLITAKSVRIMTASLIAVVFSLFGSTIIKVEPAIPDASNFQASGLVVLQPRPIGSERTPERTFNIKSGVARLTVIGGFMYQLEIAASTEPISKEQLKLLLASKPYESLCQKLHMSAKSTDLMLCFFGYIQPESKIPYNYDLAFLEAKTGRSLSYKSEGSLGVSVNNIELKRNGQVNLSLNHVIEQELGTVKVDVKFNTQILQVLQENY